ncbi:FAD dependent oxidoreductase [Mytilinidion resinicola]|uniref:FAD dependent oxidoreductase n=1 Tax=Mytilinidion resinicola TaxID=574789 RepID=A0A6A6Z4T2_9PEZI|nr:FAD dependent oxidoreductase [Mytilinidion resinicola]KAF2815749.1 FAD dependent oxidoreductase [Mytilinidion resinicola]
MEARARIPVSPPHPNPTASYWHTPLSPLANHLSAKTLPETIDTVIIGSGISGAMVAWNLLSAHPSQSTLMLEARTACGGASGRNGGHTKAASYRTYATHASELGKAEALRIARLEHANILATHAFAKEQGIDCENALCETVDIIYDPATFKQAVVAVKMIEADVRPEEREEGGVGAYKIWSKEEAMEKFYVAGENESEAVKGKEEVVGALSYLAGRLSAYKFVTGVLGLCVEKGMGLFTHTPASDIKPVPDAKDGFTWEIRTARGAVRAKNVVVTTNGYTANLLPEMQGRIVPLRGQITAQRPGPKARLPTLLPTTYSFIYRNGYEYMIPRPVPTTPEGQHIVIGGGLGRLPNDGASEFGTCDDSILNPETSRYLKETAKGFFGERNWGEQGEGGKERIVQEWTGIMGATTDGVPFVGEMPGKKGLWLSAGFNGHGMVLCFKSADALTHLLSGGAPDEIDWFPKSFLLTEKRIRESVFEGRRDMKL